MAELRVIRSYGHNGAFNMAEDEALFRAAIERQTTAIILRVYDWHPACLSLGYFQSITRRADLDACTRHGYDVVRRPTGGRAVLHDKELTYCVVAPSDDLGGTTLDSYLELSKALNAGLNILGVPSEIAPAKKAKHIGSPACFDSLSSYEIAVHGKKIVGSAQYRSQGYLLQHGSILLDVDAVRLFDCLLPKASEEELHAFTEYTTSINAEITAPVTAMQAGEAIIAGFEATFATKARIEELDTREVELRDELIRDKYTTKEWNYLK